MVKKEFSLYWNPWGFLLARAEGNAASSYKKGGGSSPMNMTESTLLSLGGDMKESTGSMFPLNKRGERPL